MKATIHVKVDWPQKAAWVYYDAMPAIEEVVSDAGKRYPKSHIGVFEDFQPTVSNVYEYGRYYGPLDLAKKMRDALEMEGYRVDIDVDMEWNSIQKD